MRRSSPPAAPAGAARPASRKSGRADREASPAAGSERPVGLDHVGSISHRLLQDANSGLPRVDYLDRLLTMLLELTAADAAALWLREDARILRCSAGPAAGQRFRLTRLCRDDREGRRSSPASTRPAPDDLALALLDPGSAPHLAGLTAGGSLTVNGPARAGRRPARGVRLGEVSGADLRSVLLVPVCVGNDRVGVLGLGSRRDAFFPAENVEAYERLAPILGCALVTQRAQAAVHERVKELTCLYGITQLSERPELRVERIVQGIVELLPAAWQYPEITVARILLDDRSYASKGFRRTAQTQTAEIVVNQRSRGCVEVAYTRRRPEIDEGPFLKEERSLIDAVARQLALIVERREAAAERARLEEQLRHADRLATIGQLAAGVAHEINEPLSNILGFAQLAKTGLAPSDGVGQDLDKIVTAALHAREIVRKLMLFARQAPPSKAEVNLNHVVSDGLYLVEARCAKQGVELVQQLAPDLPDIVADASQLQQVLVNLAVNAVQAMPEGGRLTIRTGLVDGHVSLVVEDTGTGMTDEVRRRIFVPFFTTKDVNEGTGLGLSVVHGIVTAHGGSIAVESEPGRGSRFEVRLPLAGLATFTEIDPNAVFW